MPRKINRRDFLRTGTAAGIAMVASESKAPAMLTPQSLKPVVLSDLSGIKFKNGGPQCCVEKAFEMITSGADVLESLIAGARKEGGEGQ